MTGKTPPPLSQNSELKEARDLLDATGWISDSPQTTHDLFARIIETTNTNIKSIAGSTATSKVKKRDWEMIRAATLFLKDQFECAWEDEVIDRVSKEVGIRFEKLSAAGTGHPHLESLDSDGELVERVTEALEKKFEEKLTDMMGSAKTWKLSDEPAFMQIVADRVETSLGDKMSKLTVEAEAAFTAATDISKHCDELMDTARKRMEEMAGRMGKLTENMRADGGLLDKVHENWDTLPGVTDTNGETRMSFAQAMKMGIEKNTESAARAARDSMARVGHAQAIRDAKAAYRKVVIKEVGVNADLKWVTGLSENELVHRANEALKSMTDEGEAITHASFISARKIPGGALLYLTDEAGASWLRNENRLNAWADEWIGEVSASFDVYEVVVERVPVSVDITDPNFLRSLEPINSLQANSIAKARWIKPIERRNPNQKTAYAMLYFTKPETANLIIRNGIILRGQSLDARKSLPEPRRCLRCHKTGHFARDCKSETETCGHCAGLHSTRDCTETTTRKCTLCKVDGHGSSDRSCPSFIRRVRALHDRRTDLRYRFFVGEDPETWVITTDMQQEVFDNSWQDRLREQDAGWQRVERRGTGRLAGGPCGGGGGVPFGSAHRRQQTSSQRPIDYQQTGFASQGTLDGWMHSGPNQSPADSSTDPRNEPRAMHTDIANSTNRARSNSLPSQQHAFRQSRQ